MVGTTNGAPRYEASNCFRFSGVQAIIDAAGIPAFLRPESSEGDDSKGL